MTLYIDISHLQKNSKVLLSFKEITRSDSDDKEINWDVIEGEIEVDYIYRDLNLSIGMLELNKEGTKRKELFMEIY